MGNKNLNSRILDNVRNKIAFENLEMEERKNMNMKKKVYKLFCAFAIVIIGGAMTVNAATDGELFANIKAFIINTNGEKTELPGTITKIGDEEVYQFEYTAENEDSTATTIITSISKEEVEKNGINTEINITDDGGKSTIEFTNVIEDETEENVADNVSTGTYTFED